MEYQHSIDLNYIGENPMSVFFRNTDNRRYTTVTTAPKIEEIETGTMFLIVQDNRNKVTEYTYKQKIKYAGPFRIN